MKRKQYLQSLLGSINPLTHQSWLVFIILDFNISTLQLMVIPSGRAGSIKRIKFGLKVYHRALSVCRFHDDTAPSHSWVKTNGCSSLWGRQHTPSYWGQLFQWTKGATFSLPGGKIKCTLRGCSTTPNYCTISQVWFIFKLPQSIKVRVVLHFSV